MQDVILHAVYMGLALESSTGEAVRLGTAAMMHADYDCCCGFGDGIQLGGNGVLPPSGYVRSYFYVFLSGSKWESFQYGTLCWAGPPTTMITTTNLPRTIRTMIGGRTTITTTALPQ